MMKMEKCCFWITLMAVLFLPSGEQIISAMQMEKMEALPQTTKDEPRFIHGDIPLYPREARLAHINGTVEVRVTVKDGHVLDTVLKSGQPILAQATVGNIKTWVFESNVNETFTTKFVYEMEAEGRAAVQQTNPKIEMHLPAVVKIIARPILLEDPKQSTGKRKPSR